MKRFILSAVTAACLSTYAPTGLAHGTGEERKRRRRQPRAPEPAKLPPFNVVEASIPDMRKAMETGRVTSHELVVQYLTRIGLYEDKLHAMITTNPNALAEADERDRERAAGTNPRTVYTAFRSLSRTTS